MKQENKSTKLRTKYLKHSPKVLFYRKTNTLTLTVKSFCSLKDTHRKPMADSLMLVDTNTILAQLLFVKQISFFKKIYRVARQVTKWA